MVWALTTVIELNVTPVGPLTRIPAANPVPIKVTEVVLPCAAECGLRDVIVGEGINIRHWLQLIEEPSGLVMIGL